ncbi:hypothetical protein HK101_004658, partial [Irineochytrium annulatum]
MQQSLDWPPLQSVGRFPELPSKLRTITPNGLAPRGLYYQPADLLHLPDLDQKIRASPSSNPSIINVVVPSSPPAFHDSLPPSSTVRPGVPLSSTFSEATGVELSLHALEGRGPSLIRGGNGFVRGLRQCRVAGVLCIKNRTGVPITLQSMEVKLEIWMGGTYPKGYGEMAAWQYRLDQLKPGSYGYEELPPGDVKNHPFEFVLDSTMPPSMDVNYGPSYAFSRYRLTMSASEIPNPRKKQLATSYHHDIDVPYFTPALLKYFLTTSPRPLGMLCKPNCPIEFTVFLNTNVLVPRQRFTVTTNFINLNRLRTNPSMISKIDVELYELYGNAELQPNPNRKIFLTSCLASRHSFDASRPHPPMGFSQELTLVVPGRAPQPPNPTMPQRPPPQVNSDGRWMDLVVTHYLRVTVWFQLLGYHQEMSESVETPVVIAPCSAIDCQNLVKDEPAVIEVLNEGQQPPPIQAQQQQPVSMARMGSISNMSSTSSGATRSVAPPPGPIDDVDLDSLPPPPSY